MNGPPQVTKGIYYVITNKDDKIHIDKQNNPYFEGDRIVVSLYEYYISINNLGIFDKNIMELVSRIINLFIGLINAVLSLASLVVRVIFTIINVSGLFLIFSKEKSELR